MRTDPLYIRSFISTAVLVLAAIGIMTAFVYLTGFWGLGAVCAVLALIFAFLYGLPLSFSALRRRAGRRDICVGEKASAISRSGNDTPRGSRSEA